ncbi:VirB4 family type IV secretion system protein [Maledivibacter halophilus]|uniref:AAA-like domain-containing protein n=1 Tax=Maledivibacter halophilus TaxID=36842 RepID=A0A1T5LNX8_9FIRM|nr:DUF87 domain-containing protein [Maledivibacter halophilus]SKC77585.1 AAA-like domain-containing protein [Maledivibacter halophilus]
MKKQQENQIVNKELLSVITPMGLEIKRNNLVVGENLARIYGIIKYPQKVNYGWLSKLTNITGTVASITFNPVDSSDFIDSVSSSIIRNRNDAIYHKDPLMQQRAQRAAEDGDKIIESIDGDNQSVGAMGLSIMSLAREDKTFEKLCRKTESALASSKCKGRIMANLQEQAFKNLSPYYRKNNSINEILQRVIPMSSFIGGYPFSTSGYSDGRGYYFAKDSSGGLVVLDTWKRGGDRTNSNFTILGVAGVGKSTVVKHIAISEYMKGTKILFIDPESEYRELSLALGGDVINAGGGANGRINPLQIRDIPAINEEDEKDGLGAMALHLKNVEVFFNLYMDLSEIQRALLKSSLIELYNSFHITWDTDVRGMKNEDFPIMKDLYELVSEKSKKEHEYKDLATLLKDIAIGGDSFLFGGHSSIKTHSRCVCLDTFSLQNASDNVKKTQYFNLLTWCWNEMSKDRTEPVLLIADESYLMIDPRVPQSLVFLRDVAKRARKYEAGLAIVSHSVVDFLSPEIKMYGQALLDIPCFKVLMGSDGKNLTELKELYNLTDAEESLLAQKKRGSALLMVGSKRLRVDFDIPKYKFEYMGKAGGR